VLARFRSAGAPLGLAVALSLTAGAAGCSVYGNDLLDASGGAGGTSPGRGGGPSDGGFGGSGTTLRGPSSSTTRTGAGR